MVPTTQNSFLAKKLRMILATTPGPRGTSIKVVEVPEPALFSGISLNNPFLPDGCRREDCPQVASGEPCKGKCAKEGILYQAVCDLCRRGDNEDQDVISQYIGETSRTLYVRTIQPLAASGRDMERNLHLCGTTLRLLIVEIRM